MSPRKRDLILQLTAFGCTAGDYDNDGAPDLAVSLKTSVLLIAQRKERNFQEMSSASADLKCDSA